MADQTGIGQDDLRTRLGNHLEVDPRTIDRWMAGAPSKELCWPLLPKVQSALAEHLARDEHAGDQKAVQLQQHLAGWLFVSVAFQAQHLDARAAIRRCYSVDGQHLWSVGCAIDA